MNKKDFLKIINEEINNFDFLGNDEYLKEQEITDLLQNEDLQKQFICDSLLDRNDKIVVKVVDATIHDNAGGALFRTPDYLSIDINLNIKYRYDQTKDPIEFSLGFIGDKVAINISSDYNAGRYGASVDDSQAPEGGEWIDYVDWDSIAVNLYTIEGDEIEFVAFDKAPEKIQILLVREYCETNIESHGDYTVDMEQTDNIKNIPYC